MIQKDFIVGNGIEVRGNAFIANSIVSVDSVRFDLNAAIDDLAIGELAWNTDDNTVSVGLGVASLQLGQEEYIFIKNQSGETIGNGNVVMFAGTLGNSGRLLGRKAIADGTFPSKYIIGVATHNIDDGADGYVTTFGKIKQINTSMFAEGDILFADPAIPGGLSNTAPVAPNNKVVVAAVVNSDANNGVMFVRPTFADKLSDLQDVYIDSLVDNSTILWSSANSRFEARTIDSSEGSGESVTPVVVTSTSVPAVKNNRYILTSETAATVVLPTSPSFGDAVYIVVANDLETNEVDGSGENIMSDANNLILDQNFLSFGLLYVDETLGWIII
jgi:hypothetical protein